MPRVARAAPGGCVYHVLNRAVARLPLFRKDADYAAFEHLLLEARSVRLCIARNRPFGGEVWPQQMAARLGLTHTLRPEGRPRKRQAGVESATA